MIKVKQEKKTNAPQADAKTLIALAALILCLGSVALTFLDRGAEKLTPADPVIPAAVTEKGTQITGEEDFAPFISARLKSAWEKNHDVVGWLTVDGCEIDNQVFQYKDNSYYLRKNEEGEYDVWGCYFLDYINRHDDTSFSDRVMIIYGHSLKDYPDSEKFSKLKRYKSASFAKEHPTILFSMLNELYEWQIFGCTDIPITRDYIDPNPYEEKFDDTMGYILRYSYVDFGVDVDRNDQILLLSTCTSDENVRFVIAAKLIGRVDPAIPGEET